MELSFEKKTIKISDANGFYPPSAYLRDIYAKLFISGEKERETLLKSYKIAGYIDSNNVDDTLAYAQAIHKAVKDEAISENDIPDLLNNLPSYDGVISDTNKTLTAFKASIKLDLLNDADRELIDSDITSDFWQHQNIIEIEKKVAFFREQLRI